MTGDRELAMPGAAGVESEHAYVPVAVERGGDEIHVAVTSRPLSIAAPEHFRSRAADDRDYALGA